MESNVKTVIFDWGRTLYDSETRSLFVGVPELLRELSVDYSLALVSLANSDLPEKRRMIIEESGVTEYFDEILVGSTEKDQMYENVLVDLGIDPNEVVVVDDRVIRGIAWGNRRGATTIWLRRGKFANEVPTPETGNPTFTISNIGEVAGLLRRVILFRC